MEKIRSSYEMMTLWNVSLRESRRTQAQKFLLCRGVSEAVEIEPKIYRRVLREALRLQLTSALILAILGETFVFTACVDNISECFVIRASFSFHKYMHMHSSASPEL